MPASSVGGGGASRGVPMRGRVACIARRRATRRRGGGGRRPSAGRIVCMGVCPSSGGGGGMRARPTTVCGSTRLAARSRPCPACAQTLGGCRAPRAPRRGRRACGTRARPRQPRASRACRRCAACRARCSGSGGTRRLGRRRRRRRPPSAMAFRMAPICRQLPERAHCRGPRRASGTHARSGIASAYVLTGRDEPRP